MQVSEVVRLGFRRGNVIPLGATPTAGEQSEAVLLLNNFYRTLLGTEIGEHFIDWPVPNTQPPPINLPVLTDSVSASTWYLYPVQNVRMLTKLTAATTIYFPSDPDDGARMSIVDIGSSAVQITLNGNGRLIEGNATLVEETPTLLSRVSWFYRGDKASWERVATIALADTEMPIDDSLDELWINYLAMIAAPGNSQESAAEVVAAYQSALARAKARYRQTQAIAVNDPRVSQSTQAFGGGSNDWWG